MKKAIAAIGTALALAGCAPAQPSTPQPDPSPTAQGMPTMAPTPTRGWSQAESRLIAEWGLAPGSAAAEEFIQSAWDVCRTTQDLDTDGLAVAIQGGTTLEKRRNAVRIIIGLCPRDDVGTAAALATFGFREGQWRVVDELDEEGLTIRPGTYRTLPGVENCYWVRKDANGNIIRNDYVDSAPGGVHVTIQPGDAVFESQRCGGGWLPVIPE